MVTACPTPNTHRIVALDYLRALVVLAMMLCHIFPLIQASGQPSVIGWLLPGRTAITFAALAGVSLVLMRNPSRGYLLARAGVLALAGLLLQPLVFPIILVLLPLAVALGVAALCRTMPLPTLGWLSALSVLAAAILPPLFLPWGFPDGGAGCAAFAETGQTAAALPGENLGPILGPVIGPVVGSLMAGFWQALAAYPLLHWVATVLVAVFAWRWLHPQQTPTASWAQPAQLPTPPQQAPPTAGAQRRPHILFLVAFLAAVTTWLVGALAVAHAGLSTGAAGYAIVGLMGAPVTLCQELTQASSFVLFPTPHSPSVLGWIHQLACALAVVAVAARLKNLPSPAPGSFLACWALAGRIPFTLYLAHVTITALAVTAGATSWQLGLMNLLVCAAALVASQRGFAAQRNRNMWRRGPAEELLHRLARWLSGAHHST